MTSPARRALAAAVSAVTLAALLVAAPSSGEDGPDARARPGDRPWTGFAIPRTGRAASGWIGARRVDRSTVVYRTDPRRRGSTRVFVGARTTRNFRASGGRRVGPGKTSCAALLLGRYGVPAPSQTPADRRLQAAAVDVAVQHLLYGRGFRHDGTAQRRRTDQRANGPLVRAYAASLVDENCRLAGPYRVTLVPSATSVGVGEQVVYTATVRSHTGAPVPEVALTISPGGTSPFEARTDLDGRFTFSAGAPRPGPLTSGTVTHRLTPSQLRYLVPRARGASRVVQAGLKLGDAYPRTSTVAVQGQPVVRLLAIGTVERAASFRPRFRLGQAYPGRRPATVQVFGPFADGAETGCQPRKLIRRQRVSVTTNGTYRSEPVALGQRGRYVWRVAVPGDTYNKPATTCGGEFRVD
ncbi:Ig-like domain-containing protein [Nocardioides sp.]|uniref:Ig-like domain-containing protein n=1 Tax=Nocardioides sp. TaxID=35761 RepID=UPI0027248DE8|nr:Ig-like domain-containing protein [Nocardioides sp.]MDO9456669.1 Ig-like domain-containing protein [Nocardioides sp.]